MQANSSEGEFDNNSSETEFARNERDSLFLDETLMFFRSVSEVLVILLFVAKSYYGDYGQTYYTKARTVREQLEYHEAHLHGVQYP